MKALLFLIPLLFSLPLAAQKLDPVQWTLTSDVTKAPPGSTVPLKLTAKLEPGWHLYSLTTPPGGPIHTTAVLADNASVEKVVLYQPKPERKPDPNFGVDTETFAQEAAFLIEAFDAVKNRATGAQGYEAVLQSIDGLAPLVKSIEKFLPAARSNSELIRRNLADVLLAQGYQDLTGQIIRSVMKLVEELESALANLARLSGDVVEHATMGDNPSAGQGPAVPGVSKGDHASGQTDVDALLSGLGM